MTEAERSIYEFHKQTFEFLLYKNWRMRNEEMEDFVNHFLMKSAFRNQLILDGHTRNEIREVLKILKHQVEVNLKHDNLDKLEDPQEVTIKWHQTPFALGDKNAVTKPETVNENKERWNATICGYGGKDEEKNI